MAHEQAKIDAAAPRIFCELCRNEFIGLAHRHFIGKKLVYEVVASDAALVAAREGRT